MYDVGRSRCVVRVILSPCIRMHSCLSHSGPTVQINFSLPTKNLQLSCWFLCGEFSSLGVQVLEIRNTENYGIRTKHGRSRSCWFFSIQMCLVSI